MQSYFISSLAKPLEKTGFGAGSWNYWWYEFPKLVMRLDLWKVYRLLLWVFTDYPNQYFHIIRTPIFLYFSCFFHSKSTKILLLDSFSCLFYYWNWVNVFELFRISLKVFKKLFSYFGIFGRSKGLYKWFKPLEFDLHILKKKCFVCGFNMSFDGFIFFFHWRRGSIFWDWWHALDVHILWYFQFFSKSIF